MKMLLVIALIFEAVVCSSQTWADLALSAGLQFTAGYHRGRGDAAMFHYDRVRAVSPWYDNPQTSWRNKYKNGDPAQGPAFFMSTGGLVFLTDDWHFDNFIDNQCRNLSSSVMVWGADKTAGSRKQGWWYDITGIPNQRKPWWAYPAEYAVLFLANSAGFYTSYNVVYR